MHKLFNIQHTTDTRVDLCVIRAEGQREAVERWADIKSLGDGEHATVKIWQPDINGPFTTWNVSAERVRTYTAQLVVEPVPVPDLLERLVGLPPWTNKSPVILEAIAEIQRLRVLVGSKS